MEVSLAVSELDHDGDAYNDLTREERRQRHLRNQDLLQHLESQNRSLLVSYWKANTPITWGGDTTLHIAAGSSGVKDVLHCIRDGVEVNARNKFGETPLHCAARNGKAANIDILIRARADVDARTLSGKTALHEAALNGENSSIGALSRHDPDLDAVDEDGWTALHEAVRVGSIYCVQALVNNRASVELTNKDGQSPLMLATRLSYSNIITILLQSGSREVQSVPDHNGNTPFMIAAEEANAVILAVLLDHGMMDIDTRNKKGQTALHLAVNSVSWPCVDLLIRARATVDVKDLEGATPLFAALNKFLAEGDMNLRPIVKKLLRAKARVSEGNTETFMSVMTKMQIRIRKKQRERCYVS